MCQITMTFSSKHCSMNKEDELCFAPWVSLNSAAGCTLFSQINFRFVLLHMLSNVLVSSQLPFYKTPWDMRESSMTCRAGFRLPV